MAEYLIHAVEVKSLYVAFEVLLNEGKLMRILDAPDGNFTQKGNAFLVHGKNQIRLSVRPLEGQPEIDPRASIEMKIFEGPYGGHPGEAGKLDEFSWAQGANPISTSDFRTIHQKEIPTRAAMGPWSWEDATPYTPGDRAALEAITTAVHATLVAKDYDAFAALNVVRDKELATALDVDLRTLLETDRMMLDSLMQQDDWQVEPLDVSALEIHERSGGRLVEVTGPNKSGPIVAGAAGETIEFPLTFSNLQARPPIAGGWTITR